MARTAIIFPAFSAEYTGREIEALKPMTGSFFSYLAQASRRLNLDLNSFDVLTNNFLDDEEKSQYISYCYSCAVADILKERNVSPAYVSGYSMGIYAAFYYCGAYSFVGGLDLVHKAWNLISENSGDYAYGMGMIVGLTEEDIIELIGDNSGVEITNRNNPHTYIISGELATIQDLLDRAREEGALRTSILPASKPYHTRMLLGAVPAFSARIKEVSLLSPSLLYISSLDQHILSNIDDLEKELLHNLYHRMDWYKTMQSLINRGVDTFFECGAGDGLTRNFRFIDRTVKALSAESITDV